MQTVRLLRILADTHYLSIHAVSRNSRSRSKVISDPKVFSALFRKFATRWKKRFTFPNNLSQFPPIFKQYSFTFIDPVIRIAAYRLIKLIGYFFLPIVADPRAAMGEGTLMRSDVTLYMLFTPLLSRRLRGLSLTGGSTLNLGIE